MASAGKEDGAVEKTTVLAETSVRNWYFCDLSWLPRRPSRSRRLAATFSRSGKVKFPPADEVVDSEPTAPTLRMTFGSCDGVVPRPPTPAEEGSAAPSAGLRIAGSASSRVHWLTHADSNPERFHNSPLASARLTVS